MSDIKDFDAFWHEKEDEPIRFKALGENWELPPSPRASIMLDLMRFRKQGGMDSVIPEEAMLDLTRKLLGQEQFKRMIENENFTLSKLEDLFRWAWEQYNPQKQDGEAGNGQPSTSSSTGEQSKQTSVESTA